MADEPNTRERRALEHFRTNETVLALSGVGTSTLQGMLDKSWIEPVDPAFPIGERYRLTAAGESALNSPAGHKPRSKPKLTMLKPRLSELPPRLGTSKPK